MSGAFFPTRTATHTISSAYRTILLTDGGARVFQEFGLEAGKRYVSPFRPDAAKRNFSVFRASKGEILFKDFVSGDGGSFTALLSLYGYTTFESQIRFAARLYSIELKDEGEETERCAQRNKGNHPSFTLNAKKPKTHNPKPETSSKFYCVTQLELTNFTPVELQTLAEISGGFITAPLLERFGIRALRSYTDEGRTEQGLTYGSRHEVAFTLVVPSANGNYYAYCYFQSEKHSPFPNHAKNFHLKLGEYTNDVKFALGLNELRPNEPAFIVEGIKDCLILLAKGYNAFTLGGVQHRLHPSVVKHLKDNGNTLTILFDTDFAGLDAAERLQNSLNALRHSAHSSLSSTQHSALSTQHCILPRLEKQTTKDAPKPLQNDLADYVCEYGFDSLLEETLLSPAPLVSSNITNGATTIPAWKLTTTHDKLTDDAAALKTLRQLIQTSSRLVLRAPTGCGKTHVMLRHIAQKHYAETSGMTVFAVPTIALAEQIKEEYADLKPIVVTGNNSDMHRYYQQFEQDATPLDTSIIVVVYDSIGRVADVLWDKTTLFCIDEMHILVQDFDYRSYAMHQMSLAIHNAHKVVCLSATPELLFHHAPMNFTYCDVETPQKRPVSYSFLDYTKRDEAVLALMLMLLETMRKEERKHDTILLRVQSKSLLKRMQKLLVKHGIAEQEIALLTNDTTQHNDSSHNAEEYRVLMETRHFSRKVILATGILDTGVNILNTENVHVIMLDEKNENTIIQVANRFRNAKNVHAHLLERAKGIGTERNAQKDKGRTQSPSPSALIPHPSKEQYHFLHTLTSAQILEEAMNEQSGRNDTTHSVSRKSASRLFDTMLHFNGKGNRWHTSELAIMHKCAQIRVQMTSRAELADRLEQAGFTPITEQHPITYTLSPITLQEVAEEQKNELLQNEETVLHLLATKTKFFLAALNTISRSRSFKDKLPVICPEALLSVIKNHEETTAILTEHAALLRESRTETLVRYYSEARTLGFDHTEAIHLVSNNRDPRKWLSFTQHLAMKQREAIHLYDNHGGGGLVGLTDNVLSKHDREKLRKEEDIRKMIRNSAELGCFFTGSDGTERHIPNSIRSKKAIAERVNAYQSKLFRLTQQQAGELVDAMFHVRYVRERTKTENGVRLSGYYTFEQSDNTLRCKTLAEYVTEYGVDGTKYEAAFMARMLEEARGYEQAIMRITVQNPFSEYAEMGRSVQEVG